MSELRANVMRSLGKAFLTKRPFWGVMSGNANPKKLTQICAMIKALHSVGFILLLAILTLTEVEMLSEKSRKKPWRMSVGIWTSTESYKFALKGSFSLTENHTSIMKSNQNDPPKKKLQNKMPIFLPHPFLQSTLLSSHPRWPSSRVWPPAQQPPCRPWGRSRPQWWYTA